jgi:PAS domain-containing protein
MNPSEEMRQYIASMVSELAELARTSNLHVLSFLLDMAALEASSPDRREYRRQLAGQWDWDVERNRLMGDAVLANLFGLDPSIAADGAPIEVWLDRVHSEDRPALIAAITAARMNGKAFFQRYRVVHGDGVIWITASGRCLYNEKGAAISFPGTAFVEREACSA